MDASDFHSVAMALFITLLSSLWFLPQLEVAKHVGITRNYKFDIKMQDVTRLCHTKSIVTVNGQLTEPKVVASEGDQLLIKVVNHVQNNISLHWGVVQYRTEAIINQALQTGGGPNVSDAYTINELPGPFSEYAGVGKGFIAFPAH